MLEFNSEMAEKVYRAKYMLEIDKKLIDPLKRIDAVVTKYYPHLKGKAIEYGSKKWVGFAGGLFRSAMNPNKNVSAVNCTTLYTPKDNLESIADAWYWWGKFAAVGQGEGIDVSLLRPSGAVVHNSSNTSTGPVSFMRTFDGILKEIAQDGRRGASLISLDIRHPDIPLFIKCKDEEGVLETANISIKVSNEFMQSVEDDIDWEFFYENEYETIRKTISARKLFRMIAEHAHKSGDPGLLFWDTSKKYSNSDRLGYPIDNVNGCSEQVLDGHNVCLLSSVNLSKFHEYRYRGFIELTDFMVFVLDAFRREEIIEQRSPSEDQLKKLKEIPRIGLGVTGFADYLIREGVPYDSPTAVEKAKLIFSNLTGQAYKTSHDIAKNYDGMSFPSYDKEKYKSSPFVQMLLSEEIITDKILDFQAHVCKTTLAPNGSVSIIVESGGSGIEPIFAKYYVRRERSTTGDWKEWFIFNDLVVQELRNKGLEVNKKNADELDPEIWKTAHTINNHSKIRLISVIQKYIDSAVSVTYNLKKDATVEDIESIYMEAWKSEAKGVTVYREGSKTGVLITEDNYNEAKSKEVSSDRIAPKRPNSLPCDVYNISSKGEKLLILVGILDGKVYEVFVTHPIKDFKDKVGKIVKAKKGHYKLLDLKGKTITEDLTEGAEKEYGSMTRIISMALRHQNSVTPLQFIVDTLVKEDNFASFSRGLARVLKGYIEEGEEVKKSAVCPECGNTALVYQGGCLSCICGYSKCD